MVFMCFSSFSAYQLVGIDGGCGCLPLLAATARHQIDRSE
ncbi:hypothetical protein ART_2158 [Arthrobacter sp. PAMC 25486]|nr:hypothetical protein ART_2158 [Arthrobacter sp. PAMC 25486]